LQATKNSKIGKDEIEHCVTDTKCKALFVVGNKDASMTPIGHVKRLMKLRSDGGVGATLHEINQRNEQRTNDEYFNMVGHEDEVANVCTSWIKGLQDEIEALPSSKLMGA